LNGLTDGWIDVEKRYLMDIKSIIRDELLLKKIEYIMMLYGIVPTMLWLGNELVADSVGGGRVKMNK
jgi:hypothetical protein